MKFIIKKRTCSTFGNFTKELDWSDLTSGNQIIPMLIAYTNPVLVYISSFYQLDDSRRNFNNW